MEGLRKAGEFIFRKIKEEKKKKAEGGEGGGKDLWRDDFFDPARDIPSIQNGIFLTKS